MFFKILIGIILFVIICIITLAVMVCVMANLNDDINNKQNDIKIIELNTNHFKHYNHNLWADNDEFDYGHNISHKHSKFSKVGINF